VNTISKKFIVGFALAIAIMAANALVSYLTINTLFETSRSVDTSLKMIDTLKDVQLNITNLEIGQRNYIITGDRLHLDRSYALLEKSKGLFETLRTLTDHAPDQLAQISTLEILTIEQGRRVQHVIDVHDARGPAAATKAITSMSGGIVMEREHELVAAMASAEQTMLVNRTDQFRQNSSLSRVTFYIATFFSLALLGYICYLVYREMLERRRAEEVLKFSASHDPLTELPNRTLLAERFNQALSRKRIRKARLALLFIDLDRFKNINDTLGHEEGDRLLQVVAKRLSGRIRKSNTLARQGGDEFVVLVENVGDLKDAASVAKTILEEIGKPFQLAGKEFHISASIGISICPDDGSDLPALLKYADIAMYRAKDEGKDNYQFYSEKINRHSLARLDLEYGLRHAIERNELVLHYQPKCDVRTSTIVGMEALVRWQHPIKGLIAPEVWIPLAEETGLIVPIGTWVLRTACSQTRAWQTQGLSALRVAVNLSARQFVRAAIVEDVGRALSETGLDPRWLELEITESMMIHHPEEALKLLHDLKAMGIHLAIDDFGTGYSSLAYLKRFPIDSLKVDRSFIRNIPDDTGNALITRAIIAMAHSLQLTVVAEGVETANELEFLRQLNCDQVQGFYFSKPLTVDDFCDLLVQRQNTEGSNVRFLTSVKKIAAD
jgi:diguanylate cyclase (GGDEF)-like protein